MYLSRIYSSIFLLFFLLLCLKSSLFFKIFFVHIISFFAIWEYLRIIKLSKKKIKNNVNYLDVNLTRIRLNINDYLVLLLFQFFLLFNNNSFFIASPILIILIILPLFYFSNKKKFKYSLGLFYIFFPFLFLNEVIDDNYLFFLFITFTVTISTDVGAYIVGKTIGGIKIAPTLSPNKTWAGFFGGILATLLISNFIFQNNNFIFYGIFFLIASIVCQLGDIMESALKRSFNIKDSGSLIPGHGGILDRLDSFFTLTLFIMLLYFLNFDFSSHFVL